MKEGDVGKRVYQRRTELGLTMAELAAKTGYKSRSSIQKIEKDGRGVPQDKIVVLAQALKVSPAYLMGWTDDPNHRTNSDLPNIPGVVALELKTIPILGNVHCGTPTYAQEEYMGPVDLRVAADFGLRVEGDSMIGAGIRPGDLVLVAKQEDVDNGQLAVVLIDDDAAIKRVHRTGSTLILNAENPAYEPLIFQDPTDKVIKILGKVVACVHYFEGKPLNLENVE